MRSVVSLSLDRYNKSYNVSEHMLGQYAMSSLHIMLAGHVEVIAGVARSLCITL